MNNSEDNSKVQKIEETLLAYCRRQGLFQLGDRVIVACSGGADSMALLLFLLRRRRELGIEVLATHVNHGIRGDAARADAEFVTEACRKLGVELFVYDAVREGIAVPKNPSEEWARGLRYGWFETLSTREEACVATAHTQSDQAETVLFRMARGTGLHGLAGIPASRGRYRRPMLCLVRSETEAYCRALGQNYVQDATNEEDVYARNRIRHGAIPALQYANPAAERCIARLCAQMSELDAWLCAEAATLLETAAVEDGYDIDTLRAADGPVLNTALHSLVAPIRDAEEKYITLLHFLVMRGEGALQLTPEAGYRIQESTLVFVGPKGAELQPLPPKPFEIGNFFLPGGYFVEFRLIKYEDFLKNEPIFKKDLNCCADYAKISGSIQIRTRQPGDHFCPPGRHLRKSMKKYDNEQGLDLQGRTLRPMLARGSEVLWLWGCGFAEGLAPNDTTEWVLTVREEKMKEDDLDG